MKYSYKTVDTCSMAIDFDLTDGKVSDIMFTGGCSGNLQAITKLVDGMTVEEITDKLCGITCGRRQTSCADQLCKAVNLAAKHDEEEKGESQEKEISESSEEISEGDEI